MSEPKAPTTGKQVVEAILQSTLCFASLELASDRQVRKLVQILGWTLEDAKALSRVTPFPLEEILEAFPLKEGGLQGDQASSPREGQATDRTRREATRKALLKGLENAEKRDQRPPFKSRFYRRQRK